MEIKAEINIDQTPIEEERKDWFIHAKLELERNAKTMTNDERILAKIQEAETLYRFHKQASDQIFEKIMERKVTRNKYESCKYWYFYEQDVTSRDREIAQLECALYDLYGVKNLTKAGASRLYSPLEELDEKITSMHYRMQRGCNRTAKGEKQLIREIKKAKEAREKLVPDAAMKAEMSTHLGSKEAIEDRIKCIAAEREILKKTDLELGIKNNHLWKKLDAIDNGITRLQRKLEAVDQKKDDVYRRILQLRSLRDHASCTISS